MAEFANQTITIPGRKIIADAISTKKTITFTRIEIGDGQPPTDPENLSALTHKLFDVEVALVRPVPTYPGIWLVTGSFVAREEKGDFYFREAGIWGKLDPDGADTLIAYLNSEDTADYIKAVSAKSQMQVDLTFAIVLGNAPVLSLTNPLAIPTIEDLARLEKEMQDLLAAHNKQLADFLARYSKDLQGLRDEFDAATKLYVKKSGDTMTGALNIPAHTLSAKDIKATASITGASATLSGALSAASASLTGDLTLRNGTASGDIIAKNFRGNLIGGAVSGTTATFSGLITGNVKGNVTGNLSGNVTGNVTGGTITGSTAKFTGDVTAPNFRGNLIGGAVSGTTATFSGLITGNVKGNVTGNVTGNVKGDVTGNLTGGTVTATTAKFTGDVTALNFQGNFVGGRVSGTTGTFSDDVSTTKNFRGNLVGGVITGTSLTVTSATVNGNLTVQGTVAVAKDLSAPTIKGNFVGGSFTGTTGTFSGTVTANALVSMTDLTAPNFRGNLIGGSVSGSTANFTGDVTAPNFRGNLVGGTVSGTTGTFSTKVIAQRQFSAGTAQITTLKVTGDATFSRDLTAPTFRGNLVGGTVSGTTGTFSGTVTANALVSKTDLTAPNFRGNLIGGTVSGTSAHFTGDVTAIRGKFSSTVTAAAASFGGNVTANNFAGTINSLSVYATGTLPGSINLNSATIQQMSTAMYYPGVFYHAFQNSGNSNLPEKTGILELRRLSANLTSCYFTTPSGTTYTACLNSSTFSGWKNTNGSSAIPPGSIIAFASATPPAGWLLCDGRSLSTTSYAALFSAIGYTWGGSGTNFKIPDARGQFLRGHDNGRGLDPGRNFGTGQACGAPNITGTIFGENLKYVGDGSLSGAFYMVDESGHFGIGNRDFDNARVYFAASRCSAVYQDGLAEVRPSNIAVSYVIKY